jgi:hypothetical protein
MPLDWKLLAAITFFKSLQWSGIPTESFSTLLHRPFWYTYGPHIFSAITGQTARREPRNRGYPNDNQMTDEAPPTGRQRRPDSRDDDFAPPVESQRGGRLMHRHSTSSVPAQYDFHRSGRDERGRYPDPPRGPPPSFQQQGPASYREPPGPREDRGRRLHEDDTSSSLPQPQPQMSRSAVEHLRA